MEGDIVERLRKWDTFWEDDLLVAADEIERLRAKVAAIEAMGYEWRWTKSIDENGEQEGVWVRISREIAVERGWDCFKEGGGA